MVRVLQFLAAIESAGEGNGIGIFQIGADRQAASDTGYFRTEWPDQFGDIQSGGFPLDIRISGDDDLFDFIADTIQQFPDL